MRIGLQLRVDPARLDKLVAVATQAEADGYDVVSLPDHIGAEMAAPFVVLGALAAATSTIDVGTLVVNADLWNPVQLAWHAATLAKLSGGRFELGIGAGHTPHEYAAVGVPQAAPSVRKNRLRESTEVLARLLAGERLDHNGDHFSIVGASVGPTPNIPLLVGGAGRSLLHHAGRHADIVGLTGLGRTLADGHRHETRFGLDRLRGQVDDVAAGAKAARRPMPQLQVMVQHLEVTDDAERGAAELVETIDGLSVADAIACPWLLLGTAIEIAAEMRRHESEFGIDYFTLRNPKAARPVLLELRGD